MRKRFYIQLVSGALLASLVLFWAFVALHPSYHACIAKADQTYRQQHYSPGEQPFGTVPFGHGTITCGNAVAKNDGDAITALSTALLTIITLGLVMLGIEQLATTRAQLRGYVFADTGEACINAGHIPSMEIVIRNYGATPVRNMEIGSKVFMLKPPDIPPLISKRHGKVPQTVIPPNSHRLASVEGDKPITAEEVAAIEKGQMVLFFVGLITYTDTFGGSHETRFCWSWEGVSRTKENMVQRKITNSTEGNSWT